MDTLFNGRYKILKVIGSGGMGTVYLAESVSLGTRWAIKAIYKNAGSNFDLLAEPNMLKRLSHPALPRIVDIEQDEDYLYIIEDYIEGVSLDKQLAEHISFNEGVVVNWAKQLCDVLLYLHKQNPPVIYRDMKPANIIVSPDGRVKVIDFGIAREFKSDGGSDTAYMGTRGYAAPEQYGSGQTDGRTDIYSLGVTLYHLLTGKNPNEPPYEFLPLRQVNPKLSEGIEYIVNKCIQNNPENRYQTVKNLLYDLEHIDMLNSDYKREQKAKRLKIAVKVMLVTLFSAVILCSFRVISDERAQKYKELITQGQNALNLYDFEAAGNYFQQASALQSSNPEPYLGYAQILIKEGKYDDCIVYLTDLRASLNEIGANAQYLYLMGTAYYENGDYSNAGGYLGKAAELAPSEATYMRDTAVCYAKLGDYTKAEEILNNLINIGGHDNMTYYISGQVSLAKQEYSNAIDNYNKALEGNVDEDLKKKAYIGLSDTYKSQRTSNPDALSKQINILETALNSLSNKDDLIVTEQLAEAYFSHEDYAKSIEKFRKLLDIGYDRAYIYRNIAIIYQQQNNLQEAEKTLLEMQQKYPDNYQCYLQLAFVYMEYEGNKSETSRNYDIVMENYNKAVQYAPQGANTTDVIPLTNKINELRQKGWL